jgi:hypothetical protein
VEARGKAPPHPSLRILTTARDQMAGEPTRAVNALTALLRINDLASTPIFHTAQKTAGFAR